MSRPSALRRTLIQLAAGLAAAAQLMLCFGQLAERRQGDDARAHVEALGTSLHYAHDEAQCVGCSSTVLIGRLEAASALPPVVARTAATAPNAPLVPVVGDLLTVQTPRAPPVLS